MRSKREFYQLSLPVDLRWPRLPKWLYIVILVQLATVTIIVAQVVGLGILSAIFGYGAVEALSENKDLNLVVLMLSMVFLNLPIFFLTGLWLRLFEKRGLTSVGMKLSGALRRYAVGAGIGVMMIGGPVLLMSLFGYTAIESPFRPASIGGALFLLLGWMVQGAAEEVVTRGFVLQIVGRMSGTLIGAVVSASIFAFFHVISPNLNYIAFLNIFLFGLFASLYTLYEGGLWGVFAIHSFWNWAQGNLFGFEVSGKEVQSAIVIDLMEKGPDLLTGGMFGPEGSLIVTGMLLLSILGVYVADKRRAATL